MVKWSVPAKKDLRQIFDYLLICISRDKKKTPDPILKRQER